MGEKLDSVDIFPRLLPSQGGYIWQIICVPTLKPSNPNLENSKKQSSNGDVRIDTTSREMNQESSSCHHTKGSQDLVLQYCKI